MEDQGEGGEGVERSADAVLWNEDNGACSKPEGLDADQRIEGGVADAVDGDAAGDEEEGVRYKGGGALP